MQRLQIHPTHPQRRLIVQAARELAAGSVIVLPTDASYVLACSPDSREAVDRMRAIRQLDAKHLLTLMCRDLSELATYAQVDNRQYRFLREWTPGAYTFVLPATKEVPRRLWHPSRKTVGLRVPDHRAVQETLAEFGKPVLATSLILPGDEDPLVDGDQIERRLNGQVALLVEAESPRLAPTTVIDLTSGDPLVLRQGAGTTARMT
jgi:tRNA threonylcarbamoyl adenosine modification protein (Sua5/YciO/YrdC/YwlC family)